MWRQAHDVAAQCIAPPHHSDGVSCMRTLQDVQNEIDALIRVEWHSDYWSPLSSLARLTEEVGELAREINHTYGEKPKKVSEGQGSIAAEMADILFILASLANSIDIDL